MNRTEGPNRKDTLKLVFLAALLTGGGIMVHRTREEAPLVCKEDKWRPMIWWVSRLYSPLVANNASWAREELARLVPWLRICPWEPAPNITVPTIEKRIQTEKLNPRFWFFGMNYVALLVCFSLFLEVVLFGVQRPMLRATVSHIKAVMKAKLFKERAMPHENPNERPLLEKETQGQTALHVPTFPKIYFRIWYIAFQTYLWMNTDMAVAGGLINTTSGTAWEAYAPMLFFELGTHLICALVRYCHTGGQREQHPSLVMLPCLLPFFGNILHIWKDHMFTGLCFSVAHCRSDWQSYAAYFLGWSGIFINGYSVKVLLFSKETVLVGLRAAHWPILEASHTAAASVGMLSWESRKKELLTSIIGMCTLEKQQRAQCAELPHTVIHVIFLLIFGRSTFVSACIALSIVKVLSIEILRTFLKTSHRILLSCGTSVDATRKLWFNIYDEKDDEHRTIWRLACKGWQLQVLEEFFQEDVSVLAEAFKKNSGTTKLDFEGTNLQDISVLAEAFTTNTNFRILDLQENQIQDVSALGEALKMNSTLKQLNLCFNQIQDVSALGEALKMNSALKRLDLDHNKIQDVSALGGALKMNSTLKELILSYNKIQDVSALGEALKMNSTLEKLYLHNNKIQDVSALTEGLKSNTTLENLSIRNNGIEVGLQELTEVCRNKSIYLL